MKCKAFDIGIELEIEAVTCPGVWLCPNGQITVQIYLLGLCSQTSTMNPVFPLLCHENFKFNKTFSNLNNLFELDNKMRKELVYMELIQWEDCERGNVLATFNTTLTELLYPFPKRRGLLPGIDVDLLMEATRKFPGIIAPKLEISTKMTINEVLCSVKKDKENDVYIINPKLISSKCIPRRKVPLRQKKVCHSHRYHNSTKKKLSNKKNVTDYTNEIDHIDNFSPKTSKRVIPKKVPNDYHIDNNDNLEKDFVTEKMKQLRKSAGGPEMQCGCEETKNRCPLCEKYKCVFSDPCTCKILEEQELLSKTLRNEELKKFDVDEHLENEKRNNRHEAVQRNYAYTYKTELHSHSQKPIDFRKDKHMRSEIEHGYPTHLSLDSKNISFEDESCTDKFYRNLEQFYKKLYIRAHYKLKNERCKYEH